MKVFVTGANGMLGSMICRQLLQKTYQVKAMCLPGSDTSTIKRLKIEIVEGDILDTAFLEKEMAGCDYVIHVAALTKVWPRRDKMIRKVNLEGTLNVVKAVELNHIKRMVYIGSASSFTEGSMDKPGDENSNFTWNKFNMDYMDSKYEAQQMLIGIHTERNFPVIIVNPTFMIGPYDSLPSSGAVLIGLWRGKVPGYSEGGKNFVYSGDVAIAAVNAINMGRAGECYITGNENLSFKAFFEKACRVLDRPFELKRIPHSLILTTGAINSTYARIAGVKPVLSYGMARVAGVGQYFSVAKARTELNLPQTPIEQAIQESIEWFRENDYIQ